MKSRADSLTSLSVFSIALRTYPVSLPLYIAFHSLATRIKLNNGSKATCLERISHSYPDVLILAFDQLGDDSTSLLNVGLTCRTWFDLSRPCLYRDVNLSSHNLGRWYAPEVEQGIAAAEDQQVIQSDYHSRYRSRNVVRRQRAFLTLLTTDPQLARYVKSLTWTLIWRGFGDAGLTDADRQTWNVFSLMENVTRLDLASLHDVPYDQYVRQNPAHLFTKVTDLRLLGWMHRGLVKAIITSLDASRLRSLKLDCLQDECALPNGTPMHRYLAQIHSRNDGEYYWTPLCVDDDLLKRQEAGNAMIFPEPMWFALHLLRSHELDSLTHLQIKLPPISVMIDVRNYNTLSRELATLFAKALYSLKSISVVLGDAWQFQNFFSKSSSSGINQMILSAEYQPRRTKMASTFLGQQVTALSHGTFPCLESIRFEGFDRLEHARLGRYADPQLESLFQAIRDCPFNGIASFTKIASEESETCRPAFDGYDFGMTEDDWVRSKEVAGVS